MLDRAGFGEILVNAVDLTDAIYAAHHGEPANISIAAEEVREFDSDLEAATGPPAPLFGAYVDAEGKLRALNDLMRSAAALLARDDTNVGYVVVLRSALETAARLYWVLGPDGGHLDRAGRFLSERLRSINEGKKLNNEARMALSEIEAELFAGAERAGIPVPGAPTATDLITDLLNRPGALRLTGVDLGETASVFYRIPSASTHAALHGVVQHFEDPRRDLNARRTTPEPWEQTLVVGAGLYSAYTSAHRALLELYGWDPTDWNRDVRAASLRITEALSVERERLGTDSDDDLI
jgi:hypothetical protein